MLKKLIALLLLGFILFPSSASAAMISPYGAECTITIWDANGFKKAMPCWFYFNFWQDACF